MATIIVFAIACLLFLHEMDRLTHPRLEGDTEPHPFVGIIIAAATAMRALAILFA